jgi:protein gp37
VSENSKIEWTDHTFNPWEGCQKVGPGCDHCYAETRNARFGGGTAPNWGPGAPRRRTSAANWKKPGDWNKAHAEFFAQHGRRQRVFCASLADVFDNEAPALWRVELLTLVGATEHLDWLLLTKRIGNVRCLLYEAAELASDRGLPATAQWITSWLDGSPPPNVWLGATLVSRLEMLRDAAKLKATPAAVRFWSVEPMLGDFGELPPGLLPDWVICGGESGPGARPMHPDWARSLRDQCAAAGVPFLFKQWGEHELSYDRDRDDPDYRRCNRMANLPGRWINLQGGHGFNGERVHYAHKVGKKAAGRLLDGVEHNGFPEPQ